MGVASAYPGVNTAETREYAEVHDYIQNDNCKQNYIRMHRPACVTADGVCHPSGSGIDGCEKLRHGNGPMPMICSSLTKSVFCHQLIEERLIMVVIRRSSSGPTLVILDKLSLSKSMAQRIRSLLKL